VEENEEVEEGLVALDSIANKENGGWGPQKPEQNRLEKKSNCLIECGNYRWYLKMQAYTSQSHDNADMPKKMFQASSRSSYSEPWQSSPCDPSFLGNEIVIQSLPT